MPTDLEFGYSHDAAGVGLTLTLRNPVTWAIVNGLGADTMTSPGAVGDGTFYAATVAEDLTVGDTLLGQVFEGSDKVYQRLVEVKASGYSILGNTSLNLDAPVSEVAGNVEADWDTSEKDQIRWRLGIDGDTETPTTNVPHLSVGLVTNGTAPLRGDMVRIVRFLGETQPIPIRAVDSTGAGVDISGITPKIIIKQGDDEVQVVESGSITISADDDDVDSIATFTPDAAVTSTLRTLDWSLRDTANGDEVVMRGTITVQYATED